MSRTIASVVLVVSLLALMVMPSQALHSGHGGRYIAAQTNAVDLAMWCDAPHHQWLPDHIIDPNWIVPRPSRLFSGSPECIPTDVLNDIEEQNGGAREEWGVGGFYWRVAPAALGTLATVSAHDDSLAGDTYIQFVASRYDPATGATEDLVQEGCGTQMMVLPLDLDWHWTSSVYNIFHMFYAFLPNLGMDEDLGMCLASTGYTWATHGG